MQSCKLSPNKILPFDLTYNTSCTFLQNKGQFYLFIHYLFYFILTAIVRIRRIRGHVFMVGCNVCYQALTVFIIFCLDGRVFMLFGDMQIPYVVSSLVTSVVSRSSMVSSSALIHVSFTVSRCYLICIMIISYMKSVGNSILN